jgi:glycosyltransferase involved in cell wall biosynthesis
MMPHGMLDPYSLGVRRYRKALYLALVEGRNLRWAARTIYTTEEERELAEGEVRALAPAAIVPLGSDAPRGRDPALLREGFLRRFPPASDRRCVLFLSRIHPKKGLDRLLDVMPRLIDQRPDLLLLVVGSGEGDHMDSVKRQIDHLGLGESVLLCGHLTGDLKWGAYAVAELFVLPSRQENFGLVVAEAMQMRLPVVVSNRVNSCCYVAQSQAGVICDCDDSGALYGAVASLLDDPTTAAAMGARGHSFATAKLTWEASTDRLESCYSEVLQDR